MLTPIVPETPANVNTDRPIRYTRAGRTWWISVERVCGHTDLIPDDTSVHGAAEFAARADVKCGRCRQADWQAEQATAPSLPPLRPTSGGHGHGGGSASRPSRASATRQRRPSRDDQINDAAWWVTTCEDFLEAVARGEVHAGPHSIAYAKNKRAAALRTLRQLGAVV